MSFNEEGRLETIPPLPTRLEDIPLLSSEELRDICNRG
jgi:DNA-binding NtrC family response regulator